MKNQNKFSPFVATSAGLHIALFALVLFAPSIFPGGDVWGTETGRESSVKVRSVASLPGIELPSPPVVHENVPATDSKSLHPSEPAPKPQEKVASPADVLIPSKNAKAKQDPKPAQTASVVTPSTETPPSTQPNAVPGTGGQPAIPYGQVGTGPAQVTFSDEAFGQRYAYYVRLMSNAISEKWQQNIAGVRRGTRVYVIFKIAKDGTVSNVAIDRTSGSTAADLSAQRAVASAAMPPLPRDYSGSSVDVRFFFEYAQ